MAVYPCDWGRHRYPGPQRSIYLTFVHPDEARTTKLRLCPRHFREAHVEIKAALAEVDEDSAISNVCEACTAARDLAVYAKVYDQHEEPVTYAGDFCAQCGNALGDTLQISNGRPLRAA